MNDNSSSALLPLRVFNGEREPPQPKYALLFAWHAVAACIST